MAEDGGMKVNLTCVGKDGRGEIQFKYQGCCANPGQEESIKELNDKLDKNSEKLEKILNNTENTEKFDKNILNQTENNSGKLEEILNFWASGMFMFKTSAWLD